MKEHLISLSNNPALAVTHNFPSASADTATKSLLLCQFKDFLFVHINKRQPGADFFNLEADRDFNS